MAKKAAHDDELQQKITELTQDLQRTRADFENYRKRVESEKEAAKMLGRVKTIHELLPIIDNIDRAVAHMPKELAENAWAHGIAGLSKQLDGMLEKLRVSKIDAAKGTDFDPELHQAVQVDEGEGEHEVIAEELQPGYKLEDDVIRPAIVRVTHMASDK